MVSAGIVQPVAIGRAGAGVRVMVGVSVHHAVSIAAGAACVTPLGRGYQSLSSRRRSIRSMRKSSDAMSGSRPS
jgi:hypothetical protein